MLFKTDKFRTTWDTWVYYHDNRYYLYYLITETSPGEGFGVAVSEDGIHFTDYGEQISASDKMVFYLGTGSVWKSPNFDRDRTFICNYSEWRETEGGRKQNILFAVSDNLIHWRKLGDEYMFSPDESLYLPYEHEGGRWDCIYPLARPQGGYYGYFTATPRGFQGCGFARSEDGLRWKALPPPRFVLDGKGVTEGIEAGAVCEHNGKYYIVCGTYCNEYGMAVLTCDTPNGAFVPQQKNFGLLSNKSFMHAYFMRLFFKGDRLLVNHHSCLRENTEFDRPVTYAAPFKEVAFDDDGTLRLMWLRENELLKGAPVRADEAADMVAEGRLSGGTLTLGAADGTTAEFRIGSDGTVGIYESGSDEPCELCRKDVDFGAAPAFRLLARGAMTELYINDYFITCYTLRAPFDGLRGTDGLGELRAWRMNV